MEFVWFTENNSGPVAHGSSWTWFFKFSLSLTNKNFTEGRKISRESTAHLEPFSAKRIGFSPPRSRELPSNSNFWNRRVPYIDQVTKQLEVYDYCSTVKVIEWLNSNEIQWITQNCEDQAITNIHIMYNTNGVFEWCWVSLLERKLL